MRTVTEEFKSISVKYYQFGAKLKIPTYALDGIRNEMSIHDLLHDVVLEFLTSHREKYKPTWRTIVDAVFDINPALAKEIADKHTGGFMYVVMQWNPSKMDTRIGTTLFLSSVVYVGVLAFGDSVLIPPLTLTVIIVVMQSR